MTTKELKEKLASICRNEIARAEGGDSDELQSARAKAMAYYRCDARGDEEEGRSRVISADVADMVNATLAMLVPMLSTDAVVEFEPLGEEDEVQSKAESDVCNALIIEDNRGFIEIQEAVKDALLLRNGCLKIHVAEQSDTVTYDLPADLEPEQRAALLMPRAPGETRTANAKGDKLKVTTVTRTFEINAVPIENISYQSGYSGPFQSIRFFSERIPYTRSELIEMGLNKTMVEKLNSQSEIENPTAKKRNQSHEDGWDAESRDQDVIDCRECYVLFDGDGDGISERYRVLVSGDNQSVCLDYEEVDLIPYSLGSPFLNPHRLTGESLADHIIPIQDIKTSLQRQLLDNVTTINNGRVIYDPSQTSEEDVLNPRAGGGIRSRSPQTAVVPMIIPDVTAGILANLTYQDQIRSERGGASLDMLAADAQLVGETAHGIERQYASREALASMLATNLSETLIRGIYVLTHEFLRRYSLEPMMVRISGTYQQIDPRQWPKRTRVNVKTGMSPGQRGHLQQTLAMNIQMQMGIMQAGGGNTLADMTTLYRTAIDWLRMAGVSNPERLWIDPTSPKAQQAGQVAQQQAQQQAAQQQQLVERQFGIEEGKLQVEVVKHKGELKHDYYATDAQVAIAEAKIAGDGVITLEKQRMQNEAAIKGRIANGNSGNRGDN